MARFTKEQRQDIVRDFAVRNGGVYRPSAFVAEVEQAGEKHAAYGWFEWDDASAATRHRVEQARDFAQGLTIRFEVQTVSGGKMRVTEVEAPFAHAPVHSRQDGGGYIVTQNTDTHLHALAEEAAMALEQWSERYDGVLTALGVSRVGISRTLSGIGQVTQRQEEAA